MTIEIISSTPEQTRRIGAAVSSLLRPGDVVSLGGELGAGKTCFTQGIATGLGIGDHVTSPTFVIMREYAGHVPLVHLDVYRFERLNDLVDLGAEEVFRPEAVAVVEWGDHVEALLPRSHLRIDLLYHAHGRQLVFAARGAWVSRLRSLQELLESAGT